jgi:hypothetical protein
MSSAIPDYGLHDPVTGNQILSRDYQFNHHWYSSNRFNIYDNIGIEDQSTPSAPSEDWTGQQPFPPGMFFWDEGAG